MTNAGKIEEATGKHTPLPWYIRRGYDTNDAVGIGAHSKGPAGGWVGLHVADLPTGDAAIALCIAALKAREAGVTQHVR